MPIQKDRTDLDHFLHYGIDPKNRIIHFGTTPDNFEEESFTSFNEKTVEIAVRGFNRMLNEDSKAPISLYVHSGGGEVFSALYLVDFILSSKCQVKFFGGGQICSAATILMSICDERHLYPNTQIMIHEHSESLHGKYTNNKIDMIFSDKINERMCKIYAENSFMDDKFYKHLLNQGRDIWMTAEEVITIGLADKIVPPAKRGNFRKMRGEHLKDPPAEIKLKKLIESLNRRILKEPQPFEIKVNIPKKDECDPNLTLSDADNE